MPTQADLDNWFTYHPPLPEQIEQYQELRAVGLVFASLIRSEVPVGPEQDRAIEAIRQAVMWANAGIACYVSSDTPTPQYTGHTRHEGDCNEHCEHPSSSPRPGQTKMTPEGMFVWHEHDCEFPYDGPHWHLI